MNKSNPLLKRSYHIPLPLFDTAFRDFQKKYAFPQNILLTVILLAIAGVYVHAVIKDNTQTLGYLLIVACLAVIMVRWYKTFKLRRAVHDALKEIESDTYEMTLFDEGIVIRTEEAKPADDSPAEESAPETDSPAENEKPAGNGFQQLFPEEPVHRGPVEATEIMFGSDVKIHEFAEYFMVYLVRRNFYVIPKKDFSEDEIKTLKSTFHIS